MHLGYVVCECVAPLVLVLGVLGVACDCQKVSTRGKSIDPVLAKVLLLGGLLQKRGSGIDIGRPPAAGPPYLYLSLLGMDASDDGGCDTQDEFEENVTLKPTSIARIFDLARRRCPAEEWGEWLSVPLEHAAAEGDIELAEELVLAGASGDPIMAAMRSGQRNMVDHLLQLDYDATSLHDDHLDFALEQEDEAFVKVLLSWGLKPNADHDLKQAVGLGNEALVSILLKNGAKPDDSPDGFQWDRDYATPLLMAAKNGHAGIVRLLLDAGASAGRRLSIFEPGDDDVCGLIDKESVETESALDLAAIGGHVDVINAIIERDPSTIDSISESVGSTALLYAIRHRQVGAFGALAEAGANLDTHDRGGNTALHVATGSPQFKAILPELLRLGAQVNPTNARGFTPLCLAVERGNRVATEMLVSAGADLNRSLLNVSPLSSGMKNPMIRTLLGYGADVNTKRAQDGNTPLHLASQAVSDENVKILLEAGGDETAANSAGKTPVDVVGDGIDRFEAYTRPVDVVQDLLRKAPRDRARRRRVFLVLCRKYPIRVRLHVPPSGNTKNARHSTASTVCHR